MTPFGGVCGIAGLGSVTAFAFELDMPMFAASAFAFESTIPLCGPPAGPLLLEAPPESGTSTSMSSGRAISSIRSRTVLALAFTGSVDWLLAPPSSGTGGSFGSRDTLRFGALGFPNVAEGVAPIFSGIGTLALGNPTPGGGAFLGWPSGPMTVP